MEYSLMRKVYLLYVWFAMRVGLQLITLKNLLFLLWNFYTESGGNFKNWVNLKIQFKMFYLLDLIFYGKKVRNLYETVIKINVKKLVLL